MQEKINSLIIQYPYESIQIGLACNGQLIDSFHTDKHAISRQLIPDIDALLLKHNLTLADLAYLTINCGPGPLNTLRGILATANALYFAKQIPLIALDTLELLETVHKKNYVTIPCLKAFNKQIYIRYKQKNYHITQDMITSMLNPEEAYCFVGNGAHIHHELLSIQFPHSFCEQNIIFSTLEQCAHSGFIKFQNNEYTKELHPIEI